MKIKKINQSSGYVGSIVDNLESASNQDALSANQGKILNETKANLVTTPQTLSGDRKVNSIEVLWDGDWKLGVNANVNGTTQDFTSVIQTNTNIGDSSKYSTEEQIIGTWIDGRPIYRKTIIASVSVTSTINVAMGVTNIDLAWINFGKSFYHKNDKTISMGLLYYYDNENHVRTYINGSDVQIRVNPSSWMPGTAYIVVEYIKTTD